MVSSDIPSYCYPFVYTTSVQAMALATGSKLTIHANGMHVTVLVESDPC